MMIGYSSRQRVSELLANQVPLGSVVTLQGWVRTCRDSKVDGGLCFVSVNDGSCLAPVQIVADGTLPNFDTEVRELSAGCSVTVVGELVQSPGKGQAGNR